MRWLLAIVVLASALTARADEPASKPADPAAPDAVESKEASAEEKEAKAQETKWAIEQEKPIKNSEWRNVLRNANQTREAAMGIFTIVVTLFTILALGMLVVFTAGIAPNAVAKSSIVTRDHPVRSFVLGAVALTVGFVATFATKGVLGIVFIPLLTTALLIGLAGVSEHLGRNLWHLAGKEGNRVGHIAAGWTTFAFVSVVPLVGWFGFLPYYGAVAVGSFFSSMLGRSRPAADPYARA